MKNRYPIVTLCGSTRFKDEFIRIQKELTLKGYIVISVGLFGHSGDNEVWDEIYVINPNGYTGESTWSEICYAYMTNKRIDAIEPIDMDKIEMKKWIECWDEFDPCPDI